jgi:hypothetical protein
MGSARLALASIPPAGKAGQVKLGFGGALFAACVIVVFGTAIFSAAFVVLGDFLRGECQPGSAAEDHADSQAMRLGFGLASLFALLFVLRWWLG